MLTYQQIREVDFNAKRSRRELGTPAVNFGRFVVCFTTKGEAFLVDPDIAERIISYKWSVDNVGYLQARICNERVRLHDVVMAFNYEAKLKGSVVDHMNLDKLDNRISNLRFVHQGVNSANVRTKKNSTTGFCGVSKNARGYYEAYIRVNGKQIHLGHFDDFEEAKQARLEAETRFGFSTRPRTVKELCDLEMSKMNAEENERGGVT